MNRQKVKPIAKEGQKRRDFVSSNEKAKSQVIAEFARIARKERLGYNDFIYVCQQARRKLGLRKPKRERKLPQLLPETELKKFFRVIQECGDLQHEIMLKLLFFTAVRVSELASIKVKDVDFDQCKIFIAEGKGRKDRYILFPKNFRLALQSHLRARRIQQIVKQYREEAGITQPVHPHLFRHQMITYLTAKGLSDSQIQLISGHESKKSLEVYQHLSLKNVEQAYQEAVKSIEV
jgi:site-specific recombinase XerD